MNKYRRKLPIALIVLGLLACSKGATEASPSAPAEAKASAPAGAQVVAISVGSDGFVPSHVEVARGARATLRFTRTTDETCATAVVFPDLSLNKPLPLNQAVDVEIPTNEARTLKFQCGMGMYSSEVVVK